MVVAGENVDRAAALWASTAGIPAWTSFPRLPAPPISLSRVLLRFALNGHHRRQHVRPVLALRRLRFRRRPRQTRAPRDVTRQAPTSLRLSGLGLACERTLSLSLSTPTAVLYLPHPSLVRRLPPCLCLCALLPMLQRPRSCSCAYYSTPVPSNPARGVTCSLADHLRPLGPAPPVRLCELATVSHGRAPRASVLLTSPARPFAPTQSYQ